MDDEPSTSELPAGHQLGRYTVSRELGRGGMGVVYLARDVRLDRDVALKLIGKTTDDTIVQRFWREARAAASVSHPNICQVYEVEDSPLGICIAMELLDGEPLEARLLRGALPPADAMRITVELLSALGALHARGLVHRDIKPSNVFCTTHGAKVLDFGLARPPVPVDDGKSPSITQTGTMMGTPRYMAPEQVVGEALDQRTDLYAAGAVLFEMLAGRPPFVGRTLVDQMYATMHEKPPALQGPPAVIAIDRVIRRALEKAPRDRFPDAAAMAQELALIDISSGQSRLVPVSALTRLVVPPLRLMRPDPDVTFLSYGLADAISGSLASIGDVVVRAPSVASDWAAPGADLRRLAAQADVDLVLAGNLMRAGAQLRATMQLIEASTGTVLGASTVNGSMDDIFALEDALTQAALTLLAPRRPEHKSDTTTLHRDVPATGRAFELFLRGLELMRALHRAPEARQLFDEAVETDPLFAPAWAALGRCHRVVGKYFEDPVGNDRRAEDALRRALALSPELPSAHRWLTHLEAEQGRADVAVARLLGHAKVNRNDAQLFAGLVHACRYAGLVDASIAAHTEARRLDPTVPTSVEYAYLHRSDSAHLLRMLQPDTPAKERDVHLVLLALLGNEPRLRELGGRTDRTELPAAYFLVLDALHACAFADPEEAQRKLDAGVAAYRDPEALLMFAMGNLRIGAFDRAMALLERVVSGGCIPLQLMEENALFAPLRALPAYPALADGARRRVAMARAIFERGGGRELLGL